MTTVPCPRCGMPLELVEEVCPHCRTPRNDMELEEGRSLVRKEELRLKRRPQLIAAGAAAAILLPAAWLLRGLVTSPLGTKWRAFQLEVEETRQPDHWIKDKAPGPVIINTPASTPSTFIRYPEQSPNGATEAAIKAFSHETPPVAAPLVAAPAAAAPADAVAAPVPPAPHWSLRSWYGVVYDLMTLKPIADAKLTFKVKGKFTATTTTDAAGHYLVGLSKGAENNQLSVSIDNAPGYREGLIEDLDPPLRERSRDARRMIMEETTDNDLEPVPMRCKESAEVVELNLVLVPLAKK